MHDTRSVTSGRGSDRWRASGFLSAMSDVRKHSNNLRSSSLDCWMLLYTVVLNRVEC